MKSSLFLLFFLSSVISFGQADTIRLQKIKHSIYRCTNPSARFWYLYEEENRYYLVNLSIQEEDIEDWFKRFLNSQNLLVSEVLLRNQKEFFQFKKPNFPQEKISFEILRRGNTEVLTRSIDTGEEFCFRQLEF